MTASYLWTTEKPVTTQAVGYGSHQKELGDDNDDEDEDEVSLWPSTPDVASVPLPCFGQRASKIQPAADKSQMQLQTQGNVLKMPIQVAAKKGPAPAAKGLGLPNGGVYMCKAVPPPPPPLTAAAPIFQPGQYLDTRGRRIDKHDGNPYTFADFHKHYALTMNPAVIEQYWSMCDVAQPFEEDLAQWIRSNHRQHRSPKHVLKAIKADWFVRQFRDLGFGGWGNWLREKDLRGEVLLGYAAGVPGRNKKGQNAEAVVSWITQPRDHQGGQAYPDRSGSYSGWKDSMQSPSADASKWAQVQYATEAMLQKVMDSMPTAVEDDEESPAGSEAGQSQLDEAHAVTTAGRVRCPQVFPSAALARVVKELQAVILKSDSFQAVDIAIFVFGSSLNGFGTDSSDIDVVLEVKEHGSALEDRAIRMKWLQDCQSALQQSAPDTFNLLDIVHSARVPIMQLYHIPTKRTIDISINNLTPLANTHLLQTYANMDFRVKMLGLEIKQWAKERQICGAAEGWLSSYDLVLMTIYYLQAGSLQLPTLQALLPEHDWQSSGLSKKSLRDIRVARKALDGLHAKQDTLEGLRAGFFYFYANEFFWGEECVSVRLGKRIWRIDRDFADLMHVAVGFDIEDPFQVERNLACHFHSREKMEQFQAAIQETATSLQYGNVISF